MTIKQDEYKYNYILTDLEKLLIEVLRKTEIKCICEEDGDRFADCPCVVNDSHTRTIETAYGDSVVKVHIGYDSRLESYIVRIIKKDNQ